MFAITTCRDGALEEARRRSSWLTQKFETDDDAAERGAPKLVDLCRAQSLFAPQAPLDLQGTRRRLAVKLLFWAAVDCRWLGEGEE
jgi:hypothetical protein